MKLIIDVGNTNCKFGFFDNNNLIKVYSIKNESLVFYKDNMFNMVKTCFIGCVIESQKMKILKIITSKIKIKPKFINKSAFFKKLDLSLINKKQIGLDILSFAYYISANYRKGLGVCFGSATFAVGVKKNKILGVCISPNIFESVKLMTKQIKSLNDFKQKKTTNFLGFDTSSAINCGLNNIQNGLIIYLKNQMFVKYKIGKVFVSGGGVKQTINDKNIIYKNNLVLFGYEQITRD